MQSSIHDSQLTYVVCSIAMPPLTQQLSGWCHCTTPTLTHFIPLLGVVQTQPTPPHMMVHYIAMSTIIIPSFGVVWTQPMPPHDSSTPTFE